MIDQLISATILIVIVAPVAAGLFPALKGVHWLSWAGIVLPSISLLVFLTAAFFARTDCLAWAEGWPAVPTLFTLVAAIFTGVLFRQNNWFFRAGVVRRLGLASSFAGVYLVGMVLFANNVKDGCA